MITSNKIALAIGCAGKMWNRGELSGHQSFVLMGFALCVSNVSLLRSVRRSVCLSVCLSISRQFRRIFRRGELVFFFAYIWMCVDDSVCVFCLTRSALTYVCIDIAKSREIHGEECTLEFQIGFYVQFRQQFLFFIRFLLSYDRLPFCFFIS